ncbi:MAG: hypothetical protein KAS97_05105, partial [Candidatus Aminicenantes bacterium]|nr:hypothetical protein [Candidatus Aminicenantes bacterium]
IMITFKVSEDSKNVDIPLSELQEKIPRDSIIGAVYREPKPFVPSGNDTIMSGDEITVFSEKSSMNKLEKMFG